MKYKKFLEEKLSIYPLNVRKYCIPYKYWKLKIKHHPEFVRIFWKLLIHRQCKRLDKFLASEYSGANRNKLIDYENLCLINIDTLYKICKKIEKKIGLPALDFFFKGLCRRNTYKFLEASNETLV